MKEYLEKYLNTYTYKYVEKTKKEFNIDKIVSKKILQHLHIFFSKTNYSPSNKTKNHRNIKNKTIKKKK